MALLYRQVAADLSVLRRDETARTYSDHVNQLLARAHHIIYSRRKTTWMTLFRFLKDEYPAIFQRQLPYVAASLLVTIAWGVLGAALTIARPEFMRHYVGPEMIATMEQHKMWTDSIVSVAPKETSHIMTNNLSVSFLAFAGGILFGVGTFALLFNNGMMLGVIGAACHQYSMSRGAVELYCATRVVGTAGDHHCGGSGISHWTRDAVSGRISLERVGGKGGH